LEHIARGYGGLPVHYIEYNNEIINYETNSINDSPAKFDTGGFQ